MIPTLFIPDSSTLQTGPLTRLVFDAHLHIIDPRFPLEPGYRPPAFTVADYRERTAELGITGGAVVSGSFQGHDQTYLLDALERLGPGFAGVTQLPATTSRRRRSSRSTAPASAACA